MTADVDHIRQLLTQGQTEDALRIFNKKPGLKESHQFLHLYCVYTLRPRDLPKFEEPLRRNEGIRHIYAQAAYRQESLSEAQDIYAGITSPDTNAFSEEDLLVNKTALHALATWSKEHVPGIDYPEPSDNNQFEALYNYASIALARGGVDEANTLLQLAKDRCTSLKGLSDEERQVELFPILAQSAYTTLRHDILGSLPQIESLGSSYTSHNYIRKLHYYNSEVVPISVQNPYYAARLIAHHDTGDVDDDLFQFQSSVISSNKLTSLFSTNKIEALRRAVRTQSANPQSKTASVSFQSASLLTEAPLIMSSFNGKSWGRCRRRKSPCNHLPCNLMTIQQLVTSRRLRPATTFLENFISRLLASSSEVDRRRGSLPGLGALLVSMYAELGNSNLARSTLLHFSERLQGEEAQSEGVNMLLSTAATQALERKVGQKGFDATGSFGRLLEKTRSSDVLEFGRLAARAVEGPSGITDDMLQSLSTLPILKDIDDETNESFEKCGQLHGINTADGAILKQSLPKAKGLKKGKSRRKRKNKGSSTIQPVGK